MLLAWQEHRPLIEFTPERLLEEHGIPLAIMGVLVVFVALALVVTFITLLPRIVPLIVRRPADREESAQLQVPADDGLPEEELVLIAAAVAEVTRRPHRIVRIRGLTPHDLGWSFEGRMQHHQSHRVKRG